MEKDLKLHLSCEKHPGYECNTFCHNCKALLCLECAFDHTTLYAEHKTSSMQELTISTIKKLESVSQKTGSIDAVQQEIKEIDLNLSSKMDHAKETAKKIKSKILAAIDGFIDTQLGQIVDISKESATVKDELNVKAAMNISASENVLKTKKLYVEKKYDELVYLFLAVSAQKEDAQEEVKGIEIMKQNVNSLQILTYDSIGNNIEIGLNSLFNSIQFVVKGCTICKSKDQNLKFCSICQRMLCSNCLKKQCKNCNKMLCKECIRNCKKCGQELKCKNCLNMTCLKCNDKIECEKCDLGCQKCTKCIKCLEKCSKCNLEICKTCHPEKCSLKYQWANGSDIINRSEISNKTITTSQPLPKNGFKVDLEITNCENCGWSIGIMSKYCDGKETIPGWINKPNCENYGIAPCNCHHVKNVNGTGQTPYGNPVVNGNISLILDKNRNFIIEINGVSQGTIKDNVPLLDFYLAAGCSSSLTTGQIKIISVIPY